MTQRNLALLGVLGIALLFIFPPVGRFTLYAGVAMLLAALVMYWGSRSGKLRLRDRLLDAIPWRGNETVLDVGCGRGLMLVGAAKRAHQGKVVGIDVWSGYDLSGNSLERTLENAKIERVAARVEIRDGDAREIPFPDGTFEVVVSSWAIHNISVATGRDKAIREMIRVLKPGGWIGILDIEDTHEYAEALTRHGMRDVSRIGPSFIFVLPTYQVTAHKPDLTPPTEQAANAPDAASRPAAV